MKTFYKYLFLISISAFIVSCGSVADIPVVKSEPVETKSKAIIKNTIKNQIEVNTYSSKLKVGLKVNGKKHNLKGTLRIQKGEKIWVSLRKTGFEFSRILFTPDSLFMVNYIDKVQWRYNYTTLNKRLSSTDLSYSKLESLLMNKFFFSGNKPVSSRTFKKTSLQMQGNQNMIEVTEDDSDIYQYYVVLTDIFKIHKNHIEDRKNNVKISVNYDKFKTIDTKDVPTKMYISLKSKDKSIQSDITLSKIVFNKKLKFPYKTSKKYKLIKN